MSCSFDCEDQLKAAGCVQIAGIDEAGRGPLAGPVVAAAVILPTDIELPGLDDSKKLSVKKRLSLFESLVSNPGVVFSVASVDAQEIDRINILRATHEAMRRAASQLSSAPDHVLIDGLPVRPFPFPATSIIRGDSLSLSIAAASVIAKVTRDRLMECHSHEYPAYGFEKHQGYATALHLRNLRTHGPSPIHRRTFAPVADVIAQFPG